MEVRGRALYNLLSLTASKDQEVHPWQVECYRSLEDSALLKKIAELNLSIDLPTFLKFSSKCDSPESLLEMILSKESRQTEAERVYLVLFELWRRHLPEKRSVSVFCDELDHLMELYDAKEDVVEELFEHFEDLGQMMEESIDEESGPLEVMSYISSYLAHDLDAFLYDYIQDLMQSDNDEEASLLIDLFRRFSHKRRWFDFLRLKLLIKEDAFDTANMTERFVDEIIESKDIDLAFDFLSYLKSRGDSFSISKFLPEILQIASKEEAKRLYRIYTHSTSNTPKWD
jgi:hypothetical protein